MKSQPTNNTVGRPTILLAEDNIESNALASIVLRQEGYEVITAFNGLEALELAEKHLPDLIVCDVMMPHMDGYTVLQRLQSQSSTATIPFIFLSALGETSEIRIGMGLGADDYLKKPFNHKDLLRSVATRLRRNQQIRAEQYERLSQQLVEVQENERKNIATTLQTRVTPTLNGLKLSLRLLESGSIKSDPVYADARTQLDNLIQLVEDISQEMHPMMLLHLGLQSALRWLIEKYDLDIELTMQNMDYRFSPEIETTAFRIVQLSLDNVLGFAKTRAVQVHVDNRDANLVIKVTNVGTSFVLESALASEQGITLLGLYQRAALVGGQVLINSSSDSGTVILAQIPHKDEAQKPQPIAQNVIVNALNRSQASTAQSVTSSETSILIAMEQPLQRQGLKRILSGNANMQIVAEIGDLEDIGETVKKYPANVVIINPTTTNKKQGEIFSTILANSPDSRILVITSRIHPEYVIDALQQGAYGYLPIHATITDLNTAISNVARGQLYLSPAIKEQEVLAALNPIAR